MKTDALSVRPDERFGEYGTPVDAAARKGVARSAVYDALQAGRLQAYDAFGQLVVRLADVDAWEVRPNARRTNSTKAAAATAEEVENHA